MSITAQAQNPPQSAKYPAQVVSKRGYTAAGLELLPNDCLVAWLTQVFDCRHKAITKKIKDKRWTTHTTPLSFREIGRLWEDKEYLVGVRFENDTEYAMLDVDATSRWRSPKGIRQLREVLESIGLVRTIITRSSSSNGVHIWTPLPYRVGTWNLASVLRAAFQDQGIEVKGGQLEIFPNTKTWNSLYQAHRLPMQQESYLLDDELQFVEGGLMAFCSRWMLAADAQDMDAYAGAIARLKRTEERKKFARSQNLTLSQLEFKQKLETLIFEQGWTSSGQTNELTKEIVKYAYIFEGLEGKALADRAAEIAQDCSGFKEYCGHVRFIRQRCGHWAKWAMNRAKTNPDKLFHAYERKESEDLEPSGPDNDERNADAIARTKAAVKAIEESGDIPNSIGGWVKRIKSEQGVVRSTLYRDEYLVLWHPDHRLKVVEKEGDRSGSENEKSMVSAIATERAESLAVSGSSSTPLMKRLDGLGQGDGQKKEPALSQPVSQVLPKSALSVSLFSEFQVLALTKVIDMIEDPTNFQILSNVDYPQIRGFNMFDCTVSGILSNPFQRSFGSGPDAVSLAFQAYFDAIVVEGEEPRPIAKAIAQEFSLRISPKWLEPSASTFLEELDRLFNCYRDTNHAHLVCEDPEDQVHCSYLVWFVRMQLGFFLADHMKMASLSQGGPYVRLTGWEIRKLGISDDYPGDYDWEVWKNAVTPEQWAKLTRYAAKEYGNSKGIRPSEPPFIHDWMKEDLEMAEEDLIYAN